MDQQYQWGLRITTVYTDGGKSEVVTVDRECTNEADVKSRIEEREWSARKSPDGGTGPRYARTTGMVAIRRPIGEWEVPPQ